MKSLIGLKAIGCHILCLGMIIVLSIDLITGESHCTRKELWVALIFFIIAYPLVLFLIWMQQRSEEQEIKKAKENPRPEAELKKERKTWRKLSILFINIVGIVFVIMGYNGIEIEGLPGQYVGYFLIIFGLLGTFGVNIWYKGPIDPRDDPY